MTNEEYQRLIEFPIGTDVTSRFPEYEDPHTWYSGSIETVDRDKVTNQLISHAVYEDNDEEDKSYEY